MAGTDRLAPYRRKRDLRATSEPSGRRQRPSKPTAARFVIQHHDATTEHYDFRLESDGVLTSWAVPKGPSTNPRDKRLAMRTEDHPVEYADFEGVIPEGQYGAGTVLIWDHGTYRNLTEHDGEPVPVDDAVVQGHVAVWLEGEKLRGGFSLTRIRGGRDESWLLVKMRDEGADARRNPTSTQPASTRSGRTLDEIEAAAG